AVRPNSERNRHDACDGQPMRSPQPAHREHGVVPHVVEHLHAIAPLIHALADAQQLIARLAFVPESLTSAALRSLARRARRHELGDALLEMKRQLVVDVGGYVAPPKAEVA